MSKTSIPKNYHDDAAVSLIPVGVVQANLLLLLVGEHPGKVSEPDYVSSHFAHLLRDKHMPHIRFHELRHSCASLLLCSGWEQVVPLSLTTGMVLVPLLHAP